jgi:ABC-type Fe3+-hydroxamate transport system substrate-binding protein
MERSPRRKEIRMHKRFVALSAIALVCLATLAVAAPDPSQSDSKSISGVITRVDMNSKTMVVKDASGNEVTVYWNEATKVTGEPREGSSVRVDTREQDGKTWATTIDVQAKKPY